MNNSHERVPVDEVPAEGGLLGSRHQPLTKVVTDALRQRILGGELKPGDRLVEARLSKELGVSRMPVREALRALTAEGIVTIEPRHGASVTVFTAEQIREMVEVRATLEGLNAKLAAKRHDPRQIAQLQQILQDAAQLDDASELSLLAQQNQRFHEALSQVAANSVLQDIMQSLRDRTALIFTPMIKHRVRETWKEHAEIVRAVIDGDGELAALLAARHVYSAAELPVER